MALVRTLMAAAVCTLAVADASAAGYVNSTSKYDYEGWACNPGLPGYSGWLHFWRDDGVFLGALPAANQRETAVGNICGDSGLHGFSGRLDVKYEHLDNKTHTVRAYFINPDNTNFELQNSVNVLFDGGPQPYVFSYQATGACTIPSPLLAAPGWLLAETSYGYSYCNQYSWRAPLTFVYVGDPAIPVGSEVEFCAESTTMGKIPPGWQITGLVNSNTCVKGYTSTQVGNNQPSFYNYTYYDRLKIRKMN